MIPNQEQIGCWWPDDSYQEQIGCWWPVARQTFPTISLLNKFVVGGLLQGKHFRTYHLYSSISRGNWICRQLPISQCHYFTYMIYCLYACFFYVVYTNISQESLTKMYNMYTIARHPACESRLLKCITCIKLLDTLHARVAY